MNTGIFLAKNRTEDFGLDIWKYFVIPPYYNKLSLLHTRKPIIIMGGRGCGKTMLLRYLCYNTQFSPNRSDYDENVLNRIGLYWKIDTQFARTMSKRGENDIDWSNVFTHIGVLELGLGILNSLIQIKESKYPVDEKKRLLSITFEGLRGFDEAIPSDFLQLKQYIEFSLQKTQTWIGFPKIMSQPIIFPLTFLKTIVKIIREQSLLLRNTDFFVYIDEYENLLADQKRVVNTWIKHSETPLIFNVAMKRNAFDVKETMGNESIVDINDFRKFDIEQLLDKHHDIFASEILFLQLAHEQLGNVVPIPIEDLFKVDENIIKKRQSEEYEKMVVEKAKEIFPGCSQKQLAEDIIKDTKLNEQLRKIIDETLKNRYSNYSVDDFYDKSFPEATLVNFAILNRKQIHDSKLLTEFNSLKVGEQNKYKDWIHNNTIGCVLYIYNKMGRLCPFYAGFEAFCFMSKGNIRHFLELCSQSIVNCGEAFNKTLSVPVKEQSAAAKLVSTNMLNEVKSLGNKGSALYTFVIRLGTLFEYCRNNIAQSEPEQNHFTITDKISEKSSEFLSELEKWSVLYSEKVTKSKSGEFGEEYILNPIYSYYFNISYRKKRRISLKDKDFQLIAFENVENFDKLITKFNKAPNNSPDLFNYIEIR